MALPSLVLVHGGEHGADCWDLTVLELAAQEPALRVLAVDLPGRRSKPGNLGGLNIAAAVDSVVNDIESARLDSVVITGHSLAGITVPGVAARLGPQRVREMIFAACFVPPQGTTVVDTMSGPLSIFAPLTARASKPFLMPGIAARLAFCNGMTPAQRRFVMTRRYRDSVRLYNDLVDRSAMPPEIPRTWIMTLRDRVLSRRAQHRSMAALGGVDTVLCVDTCHDLMVSEPGWLAAALAQRCRLRR